MQLLKAFWISLKACLGFVIPNQYCLIVVWENWGWLLDDIISWATPTPSSSLLWIISMVHDIRQSTHARGIFLLWYKINILFVTTHWQPMYKSAQNLSIILFIKQSLHHCKSLYISVSSPAFHLLMCKMKWSSTGYHTKFNLFFFYQTQCTKAMMQTKFEL